MRMGKALYRRAVALSELGNISDALQDVRKASRCSPQKDTSILELRARLACCHAIDLLQHQKVAQAEGIFQEACDALDELQPESQGGQREPPSNDRAALQAQVTYGLAECLAFRGAVKMAGHAFRLSAQAAGRCAAIGGMASGERVVKKHGPEIWGGDMPRLGLEALDRATRCLTAVAALDDALELAQRLVDRAGAAAADSAGGAAFPAPRAHARLSEVYLCRAEVRFNQGKIREAEVRGV